MGFRVCRVQKVRPTGSPSVFFWGGEGGLEGLWWVFFFAFVVFLFILFWEMPKTGHVSAVLGVWATFALKPPLSNPFSFVVLLSSPLFKIPFCPSLHRPFQQTFLFYSFLLSHFFFFYLFLPSCASLFQNGFPKHSSLCVKNKLHYCSCFAWFVSCFAACLTHQPFLVQVKGLQQNIVFLPTPCSENCQKLFLCYFVVGHLFICWVVSYMHVFFMILRYNYVTCERFEILSVNSQSTLSSFFGGADWSGHLGGQF